MARVALYRKYRPQNFDELYGQDHIAQTLKNSIVSGNFSHAYLFCGPRGTGKTSVARILAKAINCTSNLKGNPDNKCVSCTSIINDKTMDIIEIDAASHTQVDNIREIIVERANFAPTNLKYKVYIIDEAHMLSKSSFNALLKTLEEPPAHAIFILATTEPNKIIPTIISRCQRFDFHRINNSDMVTRLKQISTEEKIKIKDDVLDLIVTSSDGGFRDAISLLDQLASTVNGEITIEKAREILGISDSQIAEDLVLALLKKDATSSFDILNQQIELGIDPTLFYKNIVEFYRLILSAVLIGLNETETTAEKSTFLKDKIKDVELKRIIEDLDIFTETVNHYKNSAVPQLGIEVAIAKICSGYVKSNSQPQQQQQKTVVAATSKAVKMVNQTVKVPIDANDQVKWQQTLLEIKSKNNSIHAFLKVCEPEFDENTVKLHFPYKFHKERIEDIKNRRVVEESLKKILGQDYIIKCFLKPISSPADIANEIKKDDLLEDALEIFGGEVIE